MSEWISVEQEPLTDGQYLCITHFCNEAFFEILQFAKNLSEVSDYDFAGVNSFGWCGFDQEHGYYIDDSVTHWMPIPEPPKEDVKRK